MAKPVASSTPLNKSFNVSEPQFPYLLGGDGAVGRVHGTVRHHDSMRLIVEAFSFGRLPPTLHSQQRPR